jgi:hypothetical protein
MENEQPSLKISLIVYLTSIELIQKKDSTEMINPSDHTYY